jgi:F-type H+-transporting ATPase subunit b
MPQFDVHFLSPLLFWSAVSFGILFFLLYRYGFPVIFRLLEERERKIRDSLEDAERIRGESQALLAQYEEKIKGAQQDVQNILEEARLKARKLVEESQEKMEREAQRTMEESRTDIERERQQALQEIRQATVDLTLTATERILERDLRDSDHQRFVADVIQEINEERRS